jgi:dinuclear metal center YbgI/SA1388 family protein
MKLRAIIEEINDWAPYQYQESYDNSRLIVGDLNMDVTKIICSLDCTEKVVDDALLQGANLIISHHPILFSGLKSITGATYVERTILLAIKNGIAILALHTNLDAISHGVNKKIGEKLGLKSLEVLSPKNDLLLKLCTYAPVSHAPAIKEALFRAGAGNIGAYDECSFSMNGEGTFRAGKGTNPFLGVVGERHVAQEVKIEVIVAKHLQNNVLKALKDAHPYEEIAYELIALINQNQDVGSGMIGDLLEPLSFDALLRLIAQEFNTPVIKYTGHPKKIIKRIAFCGGSGSELLKAAYQKGADVYISSDFKYHQFFDHVDTVPIIDVGHFEFEQFTPQLIQEHLAKKFPTFAVLLTGVNTNPVEYFIS